GRLQLRSAFRNHQLVGRRLARLPVHFQVEFVFEQTLQHGPEQNRHRRFALGLRLDREAVAPDPLGQPGGPWIAMPRPGPGAAGSHGRTDTTSNFGTGPDAACGMTRSGAVMTPAATGTMSAT